MSEVRLTHGPDKCCECVPHLEDQIEHLRGLIAPHEELVAKYFEQLQFADALVPLVRVFHNQLEEAGELDHAVWANKPDCEICNKLAAYSKVRGMK